MAVYQLPKRLHPDFSQTGRKPVGPVEVDWNHPLARGLLHFVTTNGVRAVDVTTGKVGILAGTGSPTFFTTPNEFGLEMGSGTDGMQYFSCPAQTLSDFSMGWKASFETFEAQRVPFGLTYSGNSTVRAHMQSDTWDSSDGRIEIYNNSGWGPAAEPTGSGDVYNVGDTHSITLVVVADNGSNQTVKSWYDSTAMGDITGGTQSATFTFDRVGILGRYIGSSDREWEGKFYCGWVYDRQLSEREVFELHTNPYQILKPTIPQFYFVSGAAGTAFTLNADAGSFAITGSDANLEHSRVLTAEAGSVAITGSDANLEHGRSITAEAASFDISGFPANLEHGYALAAEAGSFSITGFDATLTYASGIFITAEAGAFDITGFDATLTYTQPATLTAEAGSFSITGFDATLAYSGIENWTAQSSDAGIWSAQSPAADAWSDQTDSGSWTEQE